MDWKDMAGSKLQTTYYVGPHEQIKCPYCQSDRGYDATRLSEKRTAHGVMINEALKCMVCSNIIFLTFDYRTVNTTTTYRYVTYPERPDVELPHESWPANIATYITEARRNIAAGNWNSAAIMARTVLQAAVREFEPKKGTLASEIDDLAQKRIITDAMKDWAHHIRLIGNDVVHPEPMQPTASEEDARDLMRFTEAFLMYVYTIPWDMQLQKNRVKDAKTP